MLNFSFEFSNESCKLKFSMDKKLFLVNNVYGFYLCSCIFAELYVINNGFKRDFFSYEVQNT